MTQTSYTALKKMINLDLEAKINICDKDDKKIFFKCQMNCCCKILEDLMDGIVREDFSEEMELIGK